MFPTQSRMFPRSEGRGGGGGSCEAHVECGGGKRVSVLWLVSRSFVQVGAFGGLCGLVRGGLGYRCLSLWVF